MDLESLCRFCSLSESNMSMENIFTNNEELKTKFDNLSIDLFIMDICKIQIFRDDNLPQNICNQCKNDVINFALFIKKCQDSDEKLRDMFLKTKNNDVTNVCNKPHKRKYKIKILQKNRKKPNVDFYNKDHDENLSIPCTANLSDIPVKFDESYSKINENEKNLIKLVLHISKIASKEQIILDKKSSEISNKELDPLKSIPTNIDDLIKDNIPTASNMDDSDDCGFSSEDEIDSDTKVDSVDMKKVLKIINPYICKVCGVSLSSKSSLQVHQVTHSSDRPFGCDKCDLKFKLKSHLIGHKRNIHERLKKHCCKICQKRFFGIAQLKIHMIAHTKEYPHLCTHCGKRFSQQCYLRVHQKMHSGIKDLSCNFCEYTTGNQSAMKMHIKGVHEMDKKHQCAQCGLRFMYPSGLAEHTTIHTGVKKHQCTVCDRKFRTNSSLKEHKRIHSDEKPYKCRYCEKLFRIIGHRTVHERIHTGEKPYTCVICSKGFQTRSNMNAHQKIHNKAS